jgi:hypothetical protein
VHTGFSAFLVAVAFGLTGCQSSAPGGRTTGDSAPHLAAESASAAGLLAQEVSDASKLYVAKCARCHKFYDPAEYSGAEWRSWMIKMNKKAHLKSDQQELLSRYLEAFRTAPQGKFEKAAPGR